MMSTQRESRTGRDRRQLAAAAISFLEIDRRGKKDQRSHVVDENEVYDAEAKTSDDYWKVLFSIPSEDCR